MLSSIIFAQMRFIQYINNEVMCNDNCNLKCVYVSIYMAISVCDLRDIDRFFQNKLAVFQNLFLFRQR